MLTAFRLVRPAFADDAFSGTGARRVGGRWNSPGWRVVYTSSSIPLATLELLVRTPRRSRLRNYALIPCYFPEAIVEELDSKRLPAKWNAYPPPSLLQELGDRWLASRESAVLAVPSAVVPTDINYLLNPEHDDFRSVDIGESQRFPLDLRLLT